MGANDVTVKQKPYGVMISGPRKSVERIISEMRQTDPYGIFIVESGPPTKGHEVFRGFLQLSGELRTLPLISRALGKTGEESNVKVKLTRCRCRPGELNPIGLVLDYGNGVVEVRCPEMTYKGEHICRSRCPYGQLNIP